MKHYNQKDVVGAGAPGNYTDLFIITYADFTETTDNTAQAINLLALTIGDEIKDALMEVKTNTAGLTTSTVSLGVTGAVTQIIAASNTLAAGTEYYVPAGTTAKYPVTAADKYLVANGVCGAAEALADATAGEIWFWVSICRKSDRNIQA